MAEYVAVFGASVAAPDDPLYVQGLRCGRLLADAGFGIVNGGYGGVMEAVSRGAREAGASVIGITAPTVFPTRDAANPYLTEERPAPSLTERIHMLFDVSKGIVALPGSIGTFTELVMAWNLAHVSRWSPDPPLPIVAVGDTWAVLVGGLRRALRLQDELVACVPDVDAAVGAIVRSLRR